MTEREGDSLYWSRQTGVDWEEKTGAQLCELSVQILPPNTGLHDDIHVGLVDLNDVVHEGKIDADAAIRGREVALETGASRVRDDWDAVAVTDSHDGGNLLGVLRICHGYWELVGVYTRPARVAVGKQVLWIRGDDVFLVAELPYDV